MTAVSNSCLVRLLFALLSFYASSAAAQQGVLVNGNSQLPACAKQCSPLNQAAQACSGTTTASQQTWLCFCQSAYLKPLLTSAAGVCDQFCTNPTDNQQIQTWYKSNCGNDLGQTEHAASGSGASNSNGNGQPANNAQPNQAATTTAGTVATASPQPSTGEGNGSWWDSHYQWIIMVIVLGLGLIGLAILLTWLRRRHDRKQDQIKNGFHAGITLRPAPTGFDPNASFAANPRVVEPSLVHDSAQRTRESFMPYGYGYSRSDSRVGSRSSGIHERRSPIPREGTPVADREKETARRGDIGISSPDNGITQAPLNGIPARERSAQRSTDGEKIDEKPTN